MEKTSKEIRKNLYCGIKELELENDVLFFHYANNRGRGDNNVTITRCKIKTLRPCLTREFNKNDIISQVLTSGWRGYVNYSNYIHNHLF